MIKFDLIPYKDEDYDFVYNVKKISYEKYVDLYYGGWDESVQRKMFDEFIEKEKQHIRIIVAHDKKIGFHNSNVVDNKTFNIGNLCILPEFQNHGIGSEILKNIIKENKGRQLILRVFKINPAKVLYERFGFEVYDETNSHYLMKKI